MPGRILQTDAFVLLSRAPADRFQSFSVFSPEHGSLFVLQRIPKKPAPGSQPLDLFDEVSLQLESSNQGQTWFVREARLRERHAGIGRGYDALRFASALAGLVARNTVPEESRAQVGALLHAAFAAFGASARPDIVFFKGLYCFARDEGYPVKQEWAAALPAGDHSQVAVLLNQPLSAQSAPATEVSRLQRSLEDYLRGHTEILLD
jgi:hypothetical protein